MSQDEPGAEIARIFRQEYGRALELAGNEADRAFLSARLRGLGIPQPRSNE
jgi:predicted RNA polymerase sigma factor